MSIKPVTLTQLVSATKKDDGVWLDGVLLTMVKFIGMVSTDLPARSGPTSTLYYIQDALSSACLATLSYDQVGGGSDHDQQETDEALLTGGAVATSREELAPHVYYVFHGVPRHLDKQRGVPRSHIHIDLVHVRPLKDFNELTFHGLDVIHCHVVATK